MSTGPEGIMQSPAMVRGAVIQRNVLLMVKKIGVQKPVVLGRQTWKPPNLAHLALEEGWRCICEDYKAQKRQVRLTFTDKLPPLRAY